MVGIGVLAALILSTMALPLLDTATRHDAVRYEWRSRRRGAQVTLCYLLEARFNAKPQVSMGM
jgi:hypothetical protein